MANRFSRTELWIGKDSVAKLNKAKVAVFGLGGVGGFVCEALVRAGIQNFVLIDNDQVSISNLNRQIIATTKTIGKNKVDVMKERMLEINPEVQVTTYHEFFLPQTTTPILTKALNYVADCIDTTTAKIEIVTRCNKLNIPVISAMGTGNKLDPSKFEITDIYKTSVCPLAKVMRKELRKRKIEKLKVVYSKEEPIKVEEGQVPGSISFVPSVAGLMIAGEIIKDIIK